MINIKRGDCLQLMQDIPDASIDLIVCDLPYGLTDAKWDNIIDFGNLWEQYKRIVKPFGVVALFGQQPFSSKIVTSNPQQFSHCWYWDKVSTAGFLLVKKQPLKHLEDILIFVNTPKENNRGKHEELRRYMFDELEKSGKTRNQINEILGNQMASHYFTNGEQFRLIPLEQYRKLQQGTGCFLRDYADIKAEFYSQKTTDKTGTVGATYNPQGLIKLEKPIKRDSIGETELYGNIPMNDEWQRYTNYPRQLLTFPRESKRYHPTQKPVELLEYIIRTYSNEGETVLDNCMGGGSTGVAAINTNRNFIGFELTEKYFRVAAERLAAADAERKNSETEEETQAKKMALNGTLNLW